MSQSIPMQVRELGPLCAEFPMGAGLGKAKVRGGLALLTAGALISAGLLFKQLPGLANAKPEGQRIVQWTLVVGGVSVIGCALLLFLPAYLQRNGRVLAPNGKTAR